MKIIGLLTIIAVLALSGCGLFKKTVRESEHASSAERIDTRASLLQISATTSVGTSDRLTWMNVTEDHVTEFTAEGSVTVAPDGTISADRVKGRTTGARKDNTQEAVRDSISGRSETVIDAGSQRTEDRSQESGSVKKTSTPDWKPYGWLTGLITLAAVAWWLIRKFRNFREF